MSSGLTSSAAGAPTAGATGAATGTGAATATGAAATAATGTAGRERLGALGSGELGARLLCCWDSRRARRALFRSASSFSRFSTATSRVACFLALRRRTSSSSLASSSSSPGSNSSSSSRWRAAKAALPRRAGTVKCRFCITKPLARVRLLCGCGYGHSGACTGARRRRGDDVGDCARSDDVGERVHCGDDVGERGGDDKRAS